MMLSETVREEVKAIVWARAESIGWSDLPDTERARYYEIWTKEGLIGGRLAHYMDPRKVRVYLKDSILKPFERERMSGNERQVLLELRLDEPFISAETFIKPHGRRGEDGKIICWGKSRDWKTVLMAVFERSQMRREANPFAAVLFESGHTRAPGARIIIEEAARRLGIHFVRWLE